MATFFQNFFRQTAEIRVISQWYLRDIKKLKGHKIKIHKKLHMKSTKNDIFINNIDELLILKSGHFSPFPSLIDWPSVIKREKCPLLRINNSSILLINMSFFVLFVCIFLWILILWPFNFLISQQYQCDITLIFAIRRYFFRKKVALYDFSHKFSYFGFKFTVSRWFH